MKNLAKQKEERIRKKLEKFIWRTKEDNATKA